MRLKCLSVTRLGVRRRLLKLRDVLIGGNGAVVFAYGSGGLGGDNNLGGRTEAADVNPEGLTGFAGEIAILNIYDSILSSDDIQLAFDAVATAVGDASSSICYQRNRSRCQRWHPDAYLGCS